MLLLAVSCLAFMMVDTMEKRRRNRGVVAALPAACDFSWRDPWGSIMRPIFVCAAVVVLLASSLTLPAHATCVISADGASIDVITDNGDSAEQNCAVKCQVDTQRGVAQVSCGGNAPPLARAHALCNFERAPGYYKKVLSSEDSCKATPAGAVAPVERSAAPLPKAADPEKPSFACRIAVDGLSADAVVANPYGEETSCTVDCQMATTRAGTTFSFSFEVGGRRRRRDRVVYARRGQG